MVTATPASTTESRGVYSFQQGHNMAYQYDEMSGSEERLPSRDHNFKDRVQLAGTVSKLHPAGTFIRNTESGDSINAVAKALGVSPPNNVIKFPKK